MCVICINFAMYLKYYVILQLKNTEILVIYNILINNVEILQTIILLQYNILSSIKQHFNDILLN